MSVHPLSDDGGTFCVRSPGAVVDTYKGLVHWCCRVAYAAFSDDNDGLSLSLVDALVAFSALVLLATSCVGRIRILLDGAFTSGFSPDSTYARLAFSNQLHQPATYRMTYDFSSGQGET